MSYDISLHIPEFSDEGRALASVAASNHVTIQEAAEILLKRAALATEKKPGELLFGLLSDMPDEVDSIAEEAKVARVREQVKDYGA